MRQGFERKELSAIGGLGGSYSAFQLGILGLGMGATLAIATPVAAQVIPAQIPPAQVNLAQVPPAQITPAQDGINTQVQNLGTEITITGGQTSPGGENLFHSFDQFNVNAGETANFLTPSATEAVLGRIGGGDPSLINGIIQLTGSNADLFLLNPAGVVFGQNAALDVPASFGASTATGFGFQQDQWFGVDTGADVSGLTGGLSALRFDGAAGAIANFGPLSVVPGANLWLVGGSVLNRGSLTAPGGAVTVAAVNGNQILQLGQPGNLLQFELSPLANGLGRGAIAPLSLPELLTGSEQLRSADQATVTEQGQIILAGTQVNTQVAIAPGTTVLSGSIDVANADGVGGRAVVTGTNIFMVDGTVNASGLLGGGRVAIGGEWQGGPGLPTAQNLWVGRGSAVDASAINQGNGGVVVFWSEGSTQFLGQVAARGGAIAGDGGLVEISGRSQLGFNGGVDLSAPAGRSGSLLLDPDRIVIVAEQSNDTPQGTLESNQGGEGRSPNNEPAPNDREESMASGSGPQPLADPGDSLEGGGADPGAMGDPTGNGGDSLTGAGDPSISDSVGGANDSLDGGNDSLGGSDSVGGANDSLGGDDSSPGASDSMGGGNDSLGGGNDSLNSSNDPMGGSAPNGAGNGGSTGGNMDDGNSAPPNSGGASGDNAGSGEDSNMMTMGDSMGGAGDFADTTPGGGDDSLGGGGDSLGGGSEPSNLSARFRRVDDNGAVDGDSLLSVERGVINEADSPDATLTISKAALEAVQGEIVLTATSEIVISDGVSLNFAVPTDTDPNAPPVPITFSVTNGNFTADPTQQLVTNGRSLTIDAQSIVVGDITTTGSDGSAANVDLTATTGTITSGLIDVSASLNAGRVTVRASLADVEIAGIDARSGPDGIGGAIEVISGGRLRITSGFIDGLGRLTSLSTSGGVLSGNILIGQAGLIANPVVPFTIGDAQTNGTAGVIQAGGTDLAPPQSITTEFQVNAAQANMVSNSGAVQVTTTGNADSMLVELADNGGELRNNLSEGSRSDSDSDSGRSSFDDEPRGGDDVLSLGEGRGARGDSFRTVSLGQDINTIAYREELGDRINELTGKQLVGNLEHLRAAEYGNHWGVSYQVPVVESSFDAIQEVLRAITQNPGKMSAVLYTFAHNDNLELTLILPTGKPLRHTIKNLSLGDLRRTTAQFRRQLTNRSLGSLPRYLPAAQKLYGWIIEPFREVLDEKGVEVLQFSLGPGLRSLPIAALHDGEQFLIENFAVATIPSFALLNNDYQSLQNTTVLVAGTSQFDQLPALPAVPVEVNTIGTTWNTVNLIDEDFTLEGIRTARQQSPFAIAHLATHAFFEPGDRQDSFVQLWGSERVGVDSISALNFHTPPLELLVLSACRTAVGDDQAELGFAGLSVQSGAKSVVASLWQVSDSGTLALMAEFYDFLGELPTKAEALRQAQLAMLRGDVAIRQGQLQGTSRGAFAVPQELAKGNLDFTHPYFWASFTLVGSPW
ncbi:MAG: CHAT domain-containing protein [Cyanobacteria bacterium P01_C01_bin.89]